MKKYYTRACNFYYGQLSRKLIKNKLTLPLNGNKHISFDKIEIFIKNKKKISSKTININQINSLPILARAKVTYDIKSITSKKKFLVKTNHVLMGILNVTPDSFSDGGKFYTNKKAIKRIKEMINSGADIIDVGGESTRPESKIIPTKKEWERIGGIIKNFKKKFPKPILSVDTRSSSIM